MKQLTYIRTCVFVIGVTMDIRSSGQLINSSEAGKYHMHHVILK